jgi:TRAP transporter 4TM/12TM fusion protein
LASNNISQAQEEIEEIKRSESLISQTSKWESLTDILIIVFSSFLALFQLYTGLFGQAEFYIQRGFHVMLVLFVTPLFLLKAAKGNVTRLVYLAAFVAAVIIFACFYGNFKHHQLRLWGFGFTQTDFVTGVILIMLVFFLAQRIVGWVMPVVAGVSIGFLFLGAYAPGILHHPGYKLKFVVELSSWSEMGIFSTPVGVAASYLFLFILFGTLIEQMGTGNTLIELAKAIAGTQRGGPAKIAVVSSAMMGTISGSPVANVLTTGAFTIPLMKCLGFKNEYAGAVEAVASTGGMILPPVMGALAFAMVDYAGVSYSRIILCAAIPAIMYYLCCFFAVHFHAHKLNLKALEKHEIQKVRVVLKENWLTILPILILAVPLCMGFTPLITVSWATVSLIPVSFLGKRERWLTPGVLLRCFVKSAKNMRVITLPCALAGIISAALTVTGVGVRLSGILLQVSNGNLMVLLLLVALVTIIMGCGLPSLLAYIIQLPVTIPAIIQMGVPLVGAHLFVVYYATLAFITPPVGMSLFAASGLAGSSFLKTGWEAVKIGAAGFVVPFIFILCPSLLLLELNLGIILDVFFAVISTYILAGAVEGYIFSRINSILRIAGIVASIALMLPNRWISFVALILSAGIVAFSRISAKKAGV